MGGGNFRAFFIIEKFGGNPLRGGFKYFLQAPGFFFSQLGRGGFFYPFPGWDLVPSGGFPQSHPFYSAISLIGGFISFAILYVMLRAPFIVAVQVIVYAGAIMVLVVLGSCC